MERIIKNLAKRKNWNERIKFLEDFLRYEYDVEIKEISLEFEKDDFELKVGLIKIRIKELLEYFYFKNEISKMDFERIISFVRNHNVANTIYIFDDTEAEEYSQEFKIFDEDKEILKKIAKKAIEIRNDILDTCQDIILKIMLEELENKNRRKKWKKKK